MPVTGLGSKLGFGVETTWNTSTALTGAVQFLSESIQYSNERIEPQTLSAGNRMLTSADWRAGTSTIEGSIETQLLDTGLEEWFKLAMGGYTFDTDTHEFTPGAITESMTIQFGMGGSNAHWRRYTGVVIDSWEIDCQVGDTASVTWDVIAGGEAVSASAGAIAGTYPATVAPFTFLDVGTLTLGGQTFECVKGVTVRGENNLKRDRFCLGTSTIGDPRVETARRTYTATLTIDFEDFVSTPDWYELFIAGTEAALALQFSLGSKTLDIVGNVRVDGETPTIDGTDIIEVDVPVTFVATTAGDDSTGIQIDIVNGTTTLA